MARNTHDLVHALPDYYEKNEDHGWFKLLDAVAESLDDLEDDIDSVDRASTVQHADTVPQLEESAKLVDLTAHENESKEHFRARVLAKFPLNTCEGTPEDLIVTTATILNTNVEDIMYEKSTENGVVTLTIPKTKLDETNLSQSDLANSISRLVPAGYNVNIRLRGTLEYITPAEEDAGSYDSTQGYDTLDSNGDPEGQGGTYSGLL